MFSSRPIHVRTHTALEVLCTTKKVFRKLLGISCISPPRKTYLCRQVLKSDSVKRNETEKHTVQASGYAISLNRMISTCPKYHFILVLATISAAARSSADAYVNSPDIGHSARDTTFADRESGSKRSR
jgi:hypothetical protein